MGRDDGQDEFGVNYKEYLAWKNGEDIGDRKLPKRYQSLSLHAVAINTKAAVNKTYQQGQQKVAQMKNKAAAVQMKMSGKTEAGDQDTVAEAGVELVVNEQQANV